MTNLRLLFLLLGAFITISCGELKDPDFNDIKLTKTNHSKLDPHSPQSVCKKDHPTYDDCRYQESKRVTPIEGASVTRYQCNHQSKSLVDMVLNEYNYPNNKRPLNALICELLENNSVVTYAHNEKNHCRVTSQNNLSKRLNFYRSQGYVCSESSSLTTTSPPASSSNSPPASTTDPALVPHVCHPPEFGDYCISYEGLPPPTSPPPTQPLPTRPDPTTHPSSPHTQPPAGPMITI